MADIPTTREGVAYRLMQDIAIVEGKHIDAPGAGRDDRADREWIISTYHECLRTMVGGPARKG